MTEPRAPRGRINDAHVHFFSEQFFEALGRQRAADSPQPAADAVGLLKWDPPGSPEDLADRWISELDRHDIARCALIASVPGDEESVGRAVSRHPSRLVGFFMLDPTAPDAPSRAERALGELGLRAMCLFPAMQRYSLHDPRVRGGCRCRGDDTPGRWCSSIAGRLSVGVRKKLGLAQPLRPAVAAIRSTVHALACDYPNLTFIIPHFGAGFVSRGADGRRPVPQYLLRHVEHATGGSPISPSLTLADVFRQALKVAGPGAALVRHRLVVFSSGMEPGDLRRPSKRARLAWRRRNRPGAIFSGNFDRLFPPGA